MKQSEKDTLLEMLHDGPTKVTFIKKDGSERIMTCTSNLGFVPEQQQPKSNPKYSDEAKRVFDLEKNEWRSFRFDSVTKFE